MRGGGKRQLGISVSDRSIEIVEIDARRGMVIRGAARADLDPGVIERGMIADEDRFVHAVQELLKEAKPEFGIRRGIFSVPDAMSYLQVFRFPATMTQQELKTAIRFQAEEVIPIDLQEMASDFLITEHGKDHLDVLFVATNAAALNAYARAFRTAGIELTAASVDARCLSRLIPLIPEGKDAVLLADLGARTSTFVVIDHIGIRSSFTRHTAGEAMTAAIAEKMKLDAKKAEAAKIKNGLTGDATVKKVIQPFVDRIGKDIAETMRWHEANHESHVKEVIFVGGTSMMPGLIDALTPAVAKASAGVNLRLADVWQSVTLDDGIAVKKKEAMLYAPAIGAALYGLRANEPTFNLLATRISTARAAPPATTVNVVQAVSSDPDPDPDAEPTDVITRMSSFLPQTKQEKLKLVFAVIFMVIAIGILIGAVIIHTQQNAAIESQIEALSESRQSATANGVTHTALSAPVVAGNNGTAIPGRIVTSAALTASQAITPTGTTTIAGVATGSVTLTNKTALEQDLIATTRLQTADGTLFRLKTAVKIPANGTATADVYADKSGATGDIGPTHFIVPGLPAKEQSLIYADSSAPMSGGEAGQGGTITQADVDAAVATLTAQAKTSAATSLASLLQADDVAPPELADVSVTGVTVNPSDLTKPAASFQVTMTYTIQDLVFTNSDVVAYVIKTLNTPATQKVTAVVKSAAWDGADHQQATLSLDASISSK